MDNNTAQRLLMARFPQSRMLAESWWASAEVTDPVGLPPGAYRVGLACPASPGCPTLWRAYIGLLDYREVSGPLHPLVYRWSPNPLGALVSVLREARRVLAIGRYARRAGAEVLDSVSQPG